MVLDDFWYFYDKVTRCSCDLRDTRRDAARFSGPVRPAHLLFVLGQATA